MYELDLDINGTVKVNGEVMDLKAKLLLLLSGGEDSYADKMLAYSPYWLLPLNEASGTTASNIGAYSNADETYSASDIAGQTTAPDGGTAPLFRSADSDVVSLSSTGLDSNYTQADRTVSWWFRFDGNWAVSNLDETFRIRADGANFIRARITAANVLTLTFENGNQQVNFALNAVTHSFNDGNWHHAAITMNQTANTSAAYIDGAEVGTGTAATYAGSGVDDTVSAIGGRSTTSPAASECWQGSVWMIGSYPLLSGAQILEQATI